MIVEARGRYTVILVIASLCCVAALAAAALYRRISSAIFGGEELWQQLAVLGVAGLAVTVSFEIARRARRLVAKSRD